MVLRVLVFFAAAFFFEVFFADAFLLVFLLTALVLVLFFAAFLAGVYWAGSGPEPVSAGVVRWLDAHGNGVMLLEEQDSTIIWLIEPVVDEVSRTRGLFGALI